MKKTTLAGVLLSALVVLGFVGIVKADLNPTGTVIRQVFDAASGQYGKYRFDSVANYFVFGSTRTPFGSALGAVVVSSGVFVAQSTTTVAPHRFFRLLDAAGALVFNVSQQGRVGIGVTLPTVALDVAGAVNATSYTGDGSALTGLPGVNSTTTWTAPQYHSQAVYITSGTSFINITSSMNFNGGWFGNSIINDSTMTVRETSASTTAGPEFAGCNVGVGTLTFTTDNVPVDLKFWGTIFHSVGTTEGCALYILVDGNFVDAYTGASDQAMMRGNPVANQELPISINYRTRTALSAGSHEFCIGMAENSGGTCTMPCGTTPCVFEIREAR